MASRRSFMQGMAIGPAAALSASAGSTQSRGASQPSLVADAGAIVLAAGIHHVTGNITVRADVVLMPGASIDVVAGRTLTFIGSFSAPVAHVFTGAGVVDLNRSRTMAAYPEWWGAGPNDSRIDSLPALNACLAAYPVMHLLAADYFISDTWRIGLSNRRIWGMGKYSRGQTKGTRILVTNPAADTISIGSAGRPAEIINFVRGLDLRWMELGRTRTAQHGGGDRAAAPAGLRLRYVVNCHFEGLSGAEHAIGYSLLGVVRSFVRDCDATRSETGGADFFWGFHFDARGDIGLAGGNASVFVDDCVVALGGDPKLAQIVGAYLQGGFADTFLTRFETAHAPQAILVDGMAAALGARRKSGHANLHIVSPVLDWCSIAGIDLADLSEFALVDIVDPYVAMAPGSVAGLRMERCRGHTSMIGGQLIGWPDGDAGGDARGIRATASEGLHASGTKLLGFRHPVDLDRVGDFDLAVAINNPERPTGQPAIALRDCDRGTIRSRAKGGRAVFTAGVALRGTNQNVSIDATGLNPAGIAGGAANTVQANGRSVAAGPLGTNIVGGAMG